MKVLSVVGNRPQFIKSAPVSSALREAGIGELLVHTGQHYDRELSQVFFEELALPPGEHLDLRTSDPERMAAELTAVLRRERPDWALVYGDTNSTLAGARAAAALGIPIAHVEAGLRSGDLSMPEERNRIEVDRLASLLLCPDRRSAQTLEREGVGGRIEVVGDVMYDACLRFGPIARQRSGILARLGVEPRRYLVLTLHREANVVRNERLVRIVEGVNRLEERIVFPAHPRTRASLAAAREALGAHVRVEKPVGYLDFAALASQARVILTDSGGLQKEAYWYRVPCVTLRPSTEWVDTVEAGANRLVDDDPDALAAAVAEARFPDDPPALYGDGQAAQRLAGSLSRL